MWTKFSIVHVVVLMQFRFSRYSDWLRAGRPRDRSSSPGRVEDFHHSFLPRAVLATFVAGVLFLPVFRSLPRRSFSIRYIRSLLRPARPEQFPNQLPANPNYHSHQNCSTFLSITLPTQSSELF
jgi:hypothetical protein